MTEYVQLISSALFYYVKTPLFALLTVFVLLTALTVYFTVIELGGNKK